MSKVNAEQMHRGYWCGVKGISNKAFWVENFEEDFCTLKDEETPDNKFRTQTSDVYLFDFKVGDIVKIDGRIFTVSDVSFDPKRDHQTYIGVVNPYRGLTHTYYTRGQVVPLMSDTSVKCYVNVPFLPRAKDVVKLHEPKGELAALKDVEFMYEEYDAPIGLWSKYPPKLISLDNENLILKAKEQNLFFVHQGDKDLVRSKMQCYGDDETTPIMSYDDVVVKWPGADTISYAVVLDGLTDSSSIKIGLKDRSVVSVPKEWLKLIERHRV